MIERHVDIPTSDGKMDTFLCHPEKDGPFSAVIFYMDAPGIREELRDMARRIAAAGYYVLLPNLYYRTTRVEDFTLAANRLEDSEEERNKMWAMIKSIDDNNLIISDTQGMLDFLASEDQAQPPPYGCVGYCMSGQYIFAVAGAYGDRFAAAASFYGAGLITDRPDSPHLLADNIKAEMYFAFAEVDKYVPDRIKTQLATVLDSHEVNYRIETYAGTEHGFAFPQRHCYNKPAAERHWERLFALFRRRLS